MKVCPACSFENLPGADNCDECGVNLTIEDTNPEYRRSAPDSISVKRLREVPLRDAIVVKPTILLSDLVAQMQTKNLGCALIIENNIVLGIFTERDLLYKIKDEQVDLREIEVQHMMTPNPEVLSENDSVALALNKMAVGQFRHVPVKKASGSFTFFSVRDAVRFLF